MDPQVHALIRNVGNKSQYIESLIVEDFKEKKKDSIVEAILNNEEFLEKLKLKLSTVKARAEEEGVEYINDWGA